jgi:uncharacterized protein (TIGR00269 family)
VTCSKCGEPAITLIRYSGQHLCTSHFRELVERRVRQELRRQSDLKRGGRIAIGISGGKDSSVVTVLLHDILGARPDVALVGITVDEGIAAYRPPALERARELCSELGVEHRVVSYREVIGRTMDEIVELDRKAIPCSYCGVFRRWTLNRAAAELEADYVVTGLNLDDTAQSILMNIARGDVERLSRLGPHDHRQPGLVPRLQPMRMIPEKEVYLYAMVRGIRFHDAMCPHAGRAQRQRFRDTVAVLEEASPGTRHATVASYDQLRPMLVTQFPPQSLRPCDRCGEPTSLPICRSCTLREGLAEMA